MVSLQQALLTLIDFQTNVGRSDRTNLHVCGVWARTHNYCKFILLLICTHLDVGFQSNCGHLTVMHGLDNHRMSNCW